MAAWLRLAAPIALGLAPAVPAAAQGGAPQTALDYPQIVSVAQDCLVALESGRIDAKRLKKLGWTKARISGLGGLEQVMTAFVREDRAIILSTGYDCILKTRLVPPASPDGLAAAISGRWAVQPATDAGGTLAWRLPDRKILLSPGPADGSNVSLTVTTIFVETE